MADGAGDSGDSLLALVDPELREAARQMRATMARFSPMSIEKLAERRAWIASMAAAPSPDVSVAERVIAHLSGPGQPDVAVFIVNAKPGHAGPGILHIHGGGYNASSAKAGLPNIQKLAQALDCTIVTVEYRIAPETTYAGSVEDNYTALSWMHRNGAEIGVDPARIAILGESAGGGHGALLAIAARDRGEVPIAFQTLIYPMLDDRTGTSRQVADHVGQFGWNADANRFGWRCFLGQEPGGRQGIAAAVPARAENLAGLPPTFIGIGALDLFVDEGIAFASRLLAAGVPTELLVVPGAFHGFDTFVGSAAISRRFTEAKIDALRRGLGIAGAKRVAS